MPSFAPKLLTCEFGSFVTSKYSNPFYFLEASKTNTVLRV